MARTKSQKKRKVLVAAYAEPSTIQALTEWAEDECRSESSLAAHLLTQAVKERQANKVL